MPVTDRECHLAERGSGIAGLELGAQAGGDGIRRQIVPVAAAGRYAPAMSRPVRAVVIGLAVGLSFLLGAILFSNDPSPARPLPSRTPEPVLASCTDTLDEGAGPFNLTRVEVITNGMLTSWSFTYDGPKPTSVQWSSVSKAAGAKHVLAFGPTGEVTQHLVRDLRTGRQQNAGVPTTFGSAEGQSSSVSMSFPAALVAPQSLRGAEAAVTVPGGRTDTCVLR